MIWATLLMLTFCIINIASYKGLVRFNFLLFFFKVLVIILDSRYTHAKPVLILPTLPAACRLHFHSLAAAILNCCSFLAALHLHLPDSNTA